MPGVRLHPNYHGYKLDHPAFVKLLRLTTERRLVVQIAVSLEDERMQNATARASDVDVSPLPALLKTLPGARVVLLNWFRSVKSDAAKRLAESGIVFFDIATVESVGGVAKLTEQVSANRVVFGSHAPFFYFESAVLKLRESALRWEAETELRSGNARKLLA
jgi:predicted TIM-barrel fold metal-dependent hydrolase